MEAFNSFQPVFNNLWIILSYIHRKNMETALTIVRYKKRYVYFALVAMALFHIPLLLQKKIRFYKLMGCGKGGSFSILPDWQQWAVLVVKESIHKEVSQQQGLNDQLRVIYGSWITRWWRFWGCETLTVLLQPLESKGTWDGKTVFGPFTVQKDFTGPIAVLTRASIRLSKLRRFWKFVAPTGAEIAEANGLIFSQGIGEAPWIRQATFSVWESKEAMKSFAYKRKNHVEVIQLTHKERWYAEEMFVRFALLATMGSLKGRNPVGKAFDASAEIM